MPEIPASVSARDLVEKAADRGEVAVLLLGERHVRGVLEHDELRVRQPVRHSSTRAALIYLHDSDERQRKLAEALGDAALAELQRRGSSGQSGTDLARDDNSAG